MVALVGDHVPVLGNAILYFTLALQALEQGHIDESVRMSFPLAT